MAKRYAITHVPLESHQQMNRWGTYRVNSVRNRDFTVEEIEDIICSGSLEEIRELSRYYYRTNSIYRANIDFLASLPLYYTMVTPIFESGKGSQTQITKAFYNACNFVEKLDIKNTLFRITKEWLKTGVYFGILQEKGGKVTVMDLPLKYCRTRFKDLNNLNILEFDITYFNYKYSEEAERTQAVLLFPEVVQKAWKEYKAKKLKDTWIMIPANSGGVSFCFTEDQTPLLIASLPQLRHLKDAVGREEKRDENELYKLLIQKMPLDNNGELVFEMDEIEEIHAGVAEMLKDLDTVDVLTTVGDATLENLQDSSAATQSANRIEKYDKQAWDALGRSALLFNSDNSSSLTLAIKKDESLMKGYLSAYDTWIRYLINQRFSRTGLTFDFEILPITVFNQKEFAADCLQSAQFGYSKMRAGVSYGIKQINQLSLITFENDFLKMHEKMIPLMSSYTQTGDEKNISSKEKSSGGSSGKNINNTGGRPALPAEQKSEKTQKNIDSKS